MVLICGYVWFELCVILSLLCVPEDLWVHREQVKLISYVMTPVVDPGNFSGVQGYVLHFSFLGLPPECPRTN